ncbi:zinc transporter 9 [Trichinella spiralis]|uniref:zinc transporter 9 n=1 Tax=Trichinella spiralis TaxID=6334 RepID=UPI0001EFCE38|nr:zinc transporter 9 [Trichinella spiralis]
MLNKTFYVAKCLFKIETTHLNFRTATGYVQLAFAASRYSKGIRVPFSKYVLNTLREKANVLAVVEWQDCVSSILTMAVLRLTKFTYGRIHYSPSQLNSITL